MKVISRATIDKFIKKHPDSQSSLKSWYAEAKSANWKKPQDIKDKYKPASFLSDNRVIFNIGGNKYRLVVSVAYNTQTVFIKWIGTHAEYTKKSF